MPLPEAVRRKAERSAELVRQLAQGSQGNGATAKDDETPPGAASDVARLTAEIATLKAEKERAEQAYRALQGKYNAEVPQMATELRSLREQIKALEEAAKRKFEAGELSSLTEDERSLAGKPLMDVIAKTAREVAASEIESRVKPLNDRVDMLNRQSEAQFQVTLESIPNFDAQNNDPKFVGWLQQPDPKTGMPRNDQLQRAVAARQGLVCAEIFSAFVEGREIGASAPARQQSPDPGPGSGEGSRDLSGDDAGKKRYTRAEIAQFYAAKRRGEYRGKEAEALALERDMFAANAEGRVTG